MRYILDRPAVAGVIVGASLGVAEHIADNARVFDIQLDADDLATIEAVLPPTPATSTASEGDLVSSPAANSYQDTGYSQILFIL